MLLNSCRHNGGGWKIVGESTYCGGTATREDPQHTDSIVPARASYMNSSRHPLMGSLAEHQAERQTTWRTTLGRLSGRENSPGRPVVKNREI